jgi:small conductance mechanosensitive channel
MRIPRIREESTDELAHRSDTLSRVATRFCSIVIWAVAFVMILGAIGLDITPLLASLGFGALALGFAAQNIIRDYLNGFFIVMEDWYRVGEWITIAGMEGDVEQIGLRRTVLREVNGTLHFIPNSQVSLASNQTRDWARINLYVTVAYKENLDHVYAVINDVCQGLKDDPDWGENMTSTPSAIRVSDLGTHGVDICIRGYTKAGQQWALTGELRRRIKNRFDEEGIEIPWPHTKVYFGDTPPVVTSNAN